MYEREQFPTQTPSRVPYLITCAYFGGMDPEHYSSVLALEYGKPNVRVARVHGVPYIDQARAILTEAALRHLPDEGVIMSLDHDIIFHPASVLHLVEQCATGPYEVLAVPYPMRKEGGGIIGFPKPPEPDKPFELKVYQGGGLYEATGCGMGFTAIRVSVFRELAKSLPRVICGTRAPCWPFFALEIESSGFKYQGEDLGFYHGEDMSFCRRAQRAGFRVGLDTTQRIWHKGVKKFALEDCGYVVPMVKRATWTVHVPEEPQDQNVCAVAAPPRVAFNEKGLET